MNVYEAISDYLTNSMYNENGYHSRSTLAALVPDYDALAPDWSNAPEWAQWYCIDAFGGASWTLTEPFVNDLEWHNKDSSDWWTSAGYVELLIGIDWRLCKWQRPGVK